MRKKRPLSSTVDRPGLVAEGDTMTMPLGSATFWSVAPVSPEHMPPTMPTTPSDVTSRSTAAVAAAASMQVESARTGATVVPSRSAPLSDTSCIAISAAAAIGPASDSSGPVKPKLIPTFTGLCPSANAAVAATVAAEASRMRFIYRLPVGRSFLIVAARHPIRPAYAWKAAHGVR